MNRRSLLSAGLALPALFVRPAAAATRLDVYTNSDANISDFLSNVVRPAFQAVNRDATVNVVIARTGGGVRAIADRALAALQTRTDPQVDMIEQFDPNFPPGGIAAGLWTDWTKAGLRNYGLVNKGAFETAFSLPWRGSQVLLAFDTTKLKPADAPRTWAQLVTWIKANPGQFIYNRPDKGGSGGNFVRRAIHEVNGRDPQRFTIDNFTPERGQAMLDGAWKVLNEIAPHLYDKGAYTAGNTASIQLLAQGAVTMVPAWSDQTLQAIRQGVLPESTGLVQLSDLALCGGFSQAVVPSNAANHKVALQLADFLLEPSMQARIVGELGGFPGIDWAHLPAQLRERYAAVIPASIPTFPSGAWASAISDGWYRQVAPNLIGR